MLTDNAAVWGGGACAAVLDHCIAYLNRALQGSNHIDSEIRFSCTAPLPTTGLGNFDADPQFVAPASGDFRLRPDSPCVDAGGAEVPGPPAGPGGAPRALDGDGDGRVASDPGAHEFDPRSGVEAGWLAGQGLGVAEAVDLAGAADGDGRTMFQEWLADTDPTRQDSVFRLDAGGAGSPVVIAFPGSSNRVYSLQSTIHLAAPCWQAVAGQQGVRGTGGPTLLTDPTGLGGGMPLLSRRRPPA